MDYLEAIDSNAQKLVAKVSRSQTKASNGYATTWCTWGSFVL